MEQYYYSTTGEDVQGPIPGAELWAMLGSGSLPLDALVCPEGSETWVAVTELKPTPVTRAPSPPVPKPEPTPAPQIQPSVPTSVTPTFAWKDKRVLPAVLGMVLVALAAFLYPRLHNSTLRAHLKSCETFGTIRADAYYSSAFSSEEVVFDLAGESSAEARRIDPVHLLMQFASKLDFQPLRRIVLAKDGKQKFYVPASDLRELASSYEGGGRVWAFDHLPERCRGMSGSIPYGTWTGGWLGVSERQTEDLNSLIRDWTGF